MNLMDLMIAVGVEDNASSALSGITGNAKSVVSSIGTGLANAAKVGTAAIAGMTAGVGALTKASVENYAQFEQLVGGVETLFGHGGKTIEEYAASVGKTVDQVTDAYQYMQDSIDAVLGDADAAFRTAGLSANDYMETITSFAASLNQALGGDTMAAAKLANQTIIDMADNANKMG